MTEQRGGLMNDRHRPQYHFLPPANWMNDPNGLIQWKGQYHLFYQYNPYHPIHERIHWGHAVSSDLVHWTHLPIALTPTAGRADADGCWSGCVIDHQGTPTMLYTATSPQVVCLATSADDLLTWDYYPGNPVIVSAPPDLQAATGGHFRDPFVWREGDYWYMVMGSMQEGVGGMILLYRSLDLTAWTYLHPLLVGDMNTRHPMWTAMMWECPNFLTFGEQHVLLFSVQDTHNNKLLYPLYYSGTFQNEHFLPCTQATLVYGGYFYAPQALRDNQGRTLMWGWLMEGRSKALSQQAGWSGVMSLPTVIAPQHDGVLSFQAAPELAALRQKHWHYEHIELSETHYVLQDETRSDCLEMLIECEPGMNYEFGVKVRCSPDGQEQTRLVYQAASQCMTLEREQSSVNAAVDHENYSVVVEHTPETLLTLHIYLDRSVLEVFVNDRCYLASRIYPERPDSLGLELFAHSGSVRVRSLDIWHLASIWDDSPSVGRQHAS